MLIHKLYIENIAKKKALAIGNFDGIHSGHKAIFAETIKIASRENLTPAILTFSPNPRKYFSKSTAPINISTVREKLELARNLGIEEIYIANFNAGFAAIEAEEFAKTILVKTLKAAHVITGKNFVFGSSRAGNETLLSKWLAEENVLYSPISYVTDKAGALSSSRIREALTRGDIKTAKEILGHDYEVVGKVINGKKLGREIGFPTLNISLRNRLAPKHGVYSAEVQLSDNKIEKAVVNIGVRPSFGENPVVLEAHVFAKIPELYGQRVRVKLRDFIRAERKFENIESLKAQIIEDTKTAKESFK